MIYQLWIMFALYVLGLGFIVLFYPKIPLSLCIMSALFWGALIYIFSAVFLAFFGLYTRFIWVLMSTEMVIFIILNLNHKPILKRVSWKNTIIWGVILLCLFSSVLMITNNRHFFYLTTDSKHYVIEASHIFNTGSIITLGAGRFFRTNYGVSEALMHSLARFIPLPMLTLWHPYLWITLYTSFFTILYEFGQQKRLGKSSSVILGLLMTLWVGTAGMNWVNGYYIHVHLFTAASIFFIFYFFGKMVASEQEETEYGFLGAFALCGFGLSRAESPILIGLFLALLLGAKNFTRKEMFAVFFPPILIEFIWLTFLLFAYFGYGNLFWPDSRLMLALGAYILFTLFILIVVINKKLNNYSKKYLKIAVFLVLFNVSLLLFIINPNHQIANLFVIFNQLSNGKIWGYYWWENVIILIFIIIYKKYWQKKKVFSRTMGVIGMMLWSYIFIILDLGYFRDKYGIAWMDSANRMFSHISPIIGFYICKALYDYFPLTNLFTREELHKSNKY